MAAMTCKARTREREKEREREGEREREKEREIQWRGCFLQIVHGVFRRVFSGKRVLLPIDVELQIFII